MANYGNPYAGDNDIAAKRMTEMQEYNNRKRNQETFDKTHGISRTMQTLKQLGAGTPYGKSSSE